MAWTGYIGSPNNFDFFAQRYADTLQALAAPEAPYVTVLGSNSLGVSWPPQAGLSVSHYEVYADGSVTPTALVTNNSYWAVAGLAPGSTHSYRLAYVLTDDRRSPLSAAASGTTYSQLSTWGGIPQEWMTTHFGADLFAWPSPYADSDGDGASNGNEFLAGTDPLDPGSALRIRLEPTPQGLFLNWNTEPTLVYQVQSSTDMVNWSSLGQPRFSAGFGRFDVCRSGFRRLLSRDPLALEEYDAIPENFTFARLNLPGGSDGLVVRLVRPLQ